MGNEQGRLFDNNLQRELLQALRHRQVAIHSQIAELTRELDENREEQKRLLYGGDE